MRRRPRLRDVIDANQWWTVYVGSRSWGHLIGMVQAADYGLAMAAARSRWPDTRIGFVEASGVSSNTPTCAVDDALGSARAALA